jgi:uncharacterized membrane protein
MRSTLAAVTALLLVSLPILTACNRSPDQPAPAAAEPVAAPEPSPVAQATPPSADSDVLPPEGVLRAYVWNCDGGLTVKMKNLYRENAITLEMHEGPRKLPQVVSASGAKYSDGSLTFWTKGDSATFERQGSAPVQCREARYESLLADARERGVTYRGRGNEPGWTVEIGPGARLEFVTAYGQERHVFDAATETVGEAAGSRVFSATHGDQGIKVTVSREACADDMSGEAFDHGMVVEYGESTLRGCATALQ